VLLVLWIPFPWAWVLVFLAVFSLFFNTGPTNTVLANVTHPAVRASGFALNIFVIHALGDAISPPLIGLIAVPARAHPDVAASTVGLLGAPLGQGPLLAASALIPGRIHSNLGVGFFVVSLLMLLGGLLWLWGARYLERDTALAPARLEATN